MNKIVTNTDKTSKKQGTKIVKCQNAVCSHAFQDKQYNGMRLHNICANGDLRCSVCSNKIKINRD